VHAAVAYRHVRLLWDSAAVWGCKNAILARGWQRESSVLTACNRAAAGADAGMCTSAHVVVLRQGSGGVCARRVTWKRAGGVCDLSMVVVCLRVCVCGRDAHAHHGVIRAAQSRAGRATSHRLETTHTTRKRFYEEVQFAKTCCQCQSGVSNLANWPAYSSLQRTQCANQSCNVYLQRQELENNRAEGLTNRGILIADGVRCGSMKTLCPDW
jgi:hypothetical protein